MQKQHPLMEMSELVKAIKAVTSQRVKFDEAVQTAAVQCIGQSIVHRNVEPAKQLHDAVGSHVKSTLVAYFEKFGNIALVGKGTKRELAFFDVKKVTGKDLVWTEEYAAEVAKFHWTKAAKEVAPKSKYDAEEMLSALFKRLDKLAADPGVTVENKELYIAAKAAFLAKSASLLTAAEKQEKKEDVDQAQQDAHQRGVNRQQAHTAAREERTPATGTPATPEQMQALADEVNGRKAA